MESPVRVDVVPEGGREVGQGLIADLQAPRAADVGARRQNERLRIVLSWLLVLCTAALLIMLTNSLILIPAAIGLGLWLVYFYRRKQRQRL